MGIDEAREIWYTYDVNGVAGMTVKENNITTDYLFDKNAQGDVTHIYTVENGEMTLAAQYVYDAWGSHKVLTPAGSESTDTAFIGNVNPFRYRSYYYDEETGLYYLNARYYDPETGRFISADSFDNATVQESHLNGFNLFAYCLNNPINNIDPTGKFVLLSFVIGLLVATAVATVVGATYGGVSAAGKGENIWSGILKGALVGLMIGGSLSMIAAGIGTPLAGTIWSAIAVGAGVGSIFALGTAVDSQLKSGGFGTLNMGQLAASWIIGGTVGGAAGAAGYGLSTLGTFYGQMLGTSLASKTLLGVPVARILSKSFLNMMGGTIGSAVGGFIGGSSINYLITYSGMQDRNIPLWLATIIKAIGKFF